jgi:hypothetical protein
VGHAVPSAFFPSHAPTLLQKKPLEQWASEVHAVRHAEPSAQLKFPGHAAGTPAAHVPEPLQSRCGVTVLPEHDCGAHTVLLE